MAQTIAALHGLWFYVYLNRTAHNLRFQTQRALTSAAVIIPMSLAEIKLKVHEHVDSARASVAVI